MELTGYFPTEFDKTTSALLNTLGAMGLGDDAIKDDQQFIFNMMMTLGRADNDGGLEESMEVMDCALIGLMYHRHVPLRPQDETPASRGEGDTDYSVTLSHLSTAMISLDHMTPEQMMECASDGARLAAANLAPPEGDDTQLHMDFIAMCIIGLMVHRYGPTGTSWDGA